MQREVTTQATFEQLPCYCFCGWVVIRKWKITCWIYIRRYQSYEMTLKNLPSNLLCYLWFNRQSRLDDEIKNSFLTLRWIEKQDMFNKIDWFCSFISLLKYKMYVFISENDTNVTFCKSFNKTLLDLPLKLFNRKTAHFIPFLCEICIS